MRRLLRKRACFAAATPSQERWMVQLSLIFARCVASATSGPHLRIKGRQHLTCYQIGARNSCMHARPTFGGVVTCGAAASNCSAGQVSEKAASCTQRVLQRLEFESHNHSDDLDVERCHEGLYDMLVRATHASAVAGQHVRSVNEHQYLASYIRTLQNRQPRVQSAIDYSIHLLRIITQSPGMHIANATGARGRHQYDSNISHHTRSRLPNHLPDPTNSGAIRIPSYQQPNPAQTPSPESQPNLAQHRFHYRPRP